MYKEKLSALMDGEIIDSELLNSLSKDEKFTQVWQRYHLVRDTLRGDMSQVVHVDIAQRVALALEQEQATKMSAVVEQPRPETWQKLVFWQKIRPWASQLAQISVAACVSLAVIVGVQHYNQPITEGNYTSDTPVFNTLPMIGQPSPVSLGVPADSLSLGQGQQQKVQEQRERINAMLKDYELQRRLNAPLLVEQINDEQAAIQIPGTQSLGTQP